jgi:hypothetical protein
MRCGGKCRQPGFKIRVGENDVNLINGQMWMGELSTEMLLEKVYLLNT